MKILFFEPSSGGHRELYCKDFLNQLVKKSNRTITVALAVPSSFGTDKLDSRIIIYRLPVAIPQGKNIFFLYFSYIKNLLFALSLIKKRRFDVFHHLYIDIYKIPTFLVLLFWAPSISIFFTLHWSEMRQFTNNIFYRVFKLIEEKSFIYLLKKVKKVFVHGEAIKKAAILNLGINNKKYFISIPYPTSELTEEIINKYEARKYLKLPLNNCILLSFGGTRYEKGADILVNALSCISTKLDVVVVFAGEEKDFKINYFVKKIKELNLSNRIILRLNYISDLEQLYYYSACDAVVLPYRDNFFGHSGPFTFAVKFGKPVIVSNVSQIGWDTKKYKLGILIENRNSAGLAKAILDFLQINSKVYQSQIRDNALKYLMDNSLTKLIDIYTGVLNGTVKL